MNARQNQLFRMFLNTQSVLDKSTDKWNSVPVMVQVKNQLDELIQRIRERDKETVLDSQAVTEQKEQILEQLAIKTAILSGIVRAYYALNEDEPFPENLNFSKSKIQYAREAEVESMVVPLIEKVRAELENLADFGVTEDMINEVETTLDDFKALIGKPREIRNSVFAAINSLDELFDKTSELLKKTLDGLMLRYQLSDPAFYDEYTRARVIVD
ncbi:hypothetical protein ACT29H_08800 [Thermophagus sp. OGC60D27]|uniref:hypothetical protein n=1 Tax=Thermophagus sp. OGC60D27 TaxID=3458415 RepID=UPI004037C8B6